MTHVRIAPGCRRLTPMHVQVQAIAERFEGLPDAVSKGQALAALKQAAQPLGLSPRLRNAIDVLFAFSAPQDWQPGARPIVWPSNRKLETTLGLFAPNRTPLGALPHRRRAAGRSATTACNPSRVRSARMVQRFGEPVMPVTVGELMLKGGLGNLLDGLTRDRQSPS